MNATTLSLAAADVAQDVREVEYTRLLQQPRGDADRPLDARLVELGREARAWYATHGRPHAGFVRVAVCAIEDAAVRVRDPQTLAETVLSSTSLAERLAHAGSEHLVLGAFTAGEELETEATANWAERPDRAWYLERFGAAVVEHLRERGRAHCAELWNVGLLAPNAPGYVGWPLADQTALFELMAAHDAHTVGPIRPLPSQMLFPKNSLLSVFGTTKHDVGSSSHIVACHACALDPCAYRRAPARTR